MTTKGSKTVLFPAVLCLLLPAALQAVSVPEEGSPAPAFTLPAQDGSPVSLRDLRGRWVVLYFYPKDFTPGCTREAHGFQRDRDEYLARNAVVLGVSLDSVESHKKFCAKEGLAFKLLSDEDHEAARAYGSLGGIGPLKFAKRRTFLIDPQGLVAKVFMAVNPARHSEEVLAALGPPLKTYEADGRRPIGELFRAHEELAGTEGWTMETVYADEGLPIRVLRTKKKGPALWLLAGIHGEEPAPPAAVSLSTAVLSRLDMPAVVFPLGNPVGYAKGWRYPDSPERGKGHSVGDSDHFLPGKDGKPRLTAPASAQSAALTAKVLELAEEYPPVLSVDLHEDDHLPAGYIYSQGPKGCAGPAAQLVLGKMRELGYPIKRSGKTDFDEKIEGGVVCGVTDGSIDELISAPRILRAGRAEPGPAGRSVIVAETSSMKMDLARRVRLHQAIIRMLPELFKAARE
jgi:peroxiredoxin Q/BCP